MECHILQTTSAGDAMYASMTPIDTPVAIAALVDGTMVEVDNPLRIDALYPTAQATCARARSKLDLSSSSSSPQDPVNPGCDPVHSGYPMHSGCTPAHLQPDLEPNLQAICAELDLALLQTPVTLTVAGEVDGVEEGK